MISSWIFPPPKSLKILRKILPNLPKVGLGAPLAPLADGVDRVVFVEYKPCTCKDVAPKEHQLNR